MDDLNDKLVQAARDGELLMVQDLLKQGADASAQDSFALREAAGCHEVGDGYEDAKEGRYAEIVALLLNHGADVGAKDNDALVSACDGCDDEVTGVVGVLLAYGADLHVRDDLPLKMAASDGNEETVEMLLQHGANIEAGDGFPLYIAKADGRKSMVKLLLRYGAKGYDSDFSDED